MLPLNTRGKRHIMIRYQLYKNNVFLINFYLIYLHHRYLTNGKIFDATHSKGKSNALLFQLDGNAVIQGINEVILQGMSVGDSVQAIIPPALAYKEKVCACFLYSYLLESSMTIV